MTHDEPQQDEDEAAAPICTACDDEDDRDDDNDDEEEHSDVESQYGSDYDPEEVEEADINLAPTCLENRVSVRGIER